MTGIEPAYSAWECDAVGERVGDLVELLVPVAVHDVFHGAHRPASSLPEIAIRSDFAISLSSLAGSGVLGRLLRELNTRGQPKFVVNVSEVCLDGPR
jgi:hypothetical protein